MKLYIYIRIYIYIYIHIYKYIGGAATSSNSTKLFHGGITPSLHLSTKRLGYQERYHRMDLRLLVVAARNKRIFRSLGAKGVGINWLD